MTTDSSEPNSARKKPSGMKDIPADALTDDQASDISGGSTIAPCVKQVIPCIRPSIDPCWRPGGLPGGISSPIRGH